MDLERLFIILLITHVFGDFILQNQAMCDGKYENGWHSTHLLAHTAIIFLLMAGVVLFPYCWQIGLVALLLMLIEYAFQNLKIRPEESDGFFKKCAKFLKPYHRCIQVPIVAVFSIIALWIHYKYMMVVMVISVTHFFIDGIKSKVENMVINGCAIPNSGYELYTFSIDQFVHALVLFFCAIWINAYGWKEPAFLNFLSLKTLVFILMFYYCGAPANILTRRILVYLKIDKRDKDNQQKDDKKTGRVIGLIERRLIIFFMFIQQFAAIGFLITAKSILRFSDINQKTRNEEDQRKFLSEQSEYVLIGTFISISIAVACGFLIMIAGNPDILSVDK